MRKAKKVSALNGTVILKSDHTFICDNYGCLVKFWGEFKVSATVLKDIKRRAEFDSTSD